MDNELNIQEYIASGILELYVAGALAPEEAQEVTTLVPGAGQIGMMLVFEGDFCLFSHLIDDFKADIMSSMIVFRPGIAKADN